MQDGAANARDGGLPDARRTDVTRGDSSTTDSASDGGTEKVPRLALFVAAGESRTCAILEDGTVKCWGYNKYGQLGLGDTNRRGDSALSMGDTLSSVKLGVGDTTERGDDPGEMDDALPFVDLEAK